MNSYSKLAAASGRVPWPRESLLCKNEKEYLGMFYVYIKKFLSTLREDAELFDFFVREVEKSTKTLPDKLVNHLAEDLVFLFFPDFSSTEKTIINFLRQIKGMLARLFRDFTSGANYLLFDDNDSLINKLLTKFMESSENGNYIEMLFRKMYNEATDLSIFIKHLSKKSNDHVEERQIEGTDGNEDEHYLLIYNRNSRLIDGHFSKDRADSILDLLSEEIKISNTENLLKNSEIKLLCNWIIHRITKNLAYMPMSVRYLCKFLEQLVLQHVLLRLL
eukprot:TRINITY_DN2194_c0_g4_i2.p1 TRINITY_DN2194_c0_g4~~TRINITY_DN2194_c0_g4_i2.p1  ORF type:complete len:276 (+),score=50.31 TRINITY_DN2194_c0_g4_i2:301-1128(+)